MNRMEKLGDGRRQDKTVSDWMGVLSARLVFAFDLEAAQILFLHRGMSGFAFGKGDKFCRS